MMSLKEWHYFSPGSGAYKVFHPLLFQKALDVLRLWPHRGRELFCQMIERERQSVLSFIIK